MPYEPTWKRWTQGVLRWTWYAAWFGLAVETSARVDDHFKWGAPVFGPYSNEFLVMRDLHAVRGRPDFRYEKWGMNSLGFRGPELRPKAGRERVFVIGASETFGLFESEGGEYPARLRSILDSVAPGRFDVVNAGLPGMSPVAMLPYLRHVVAPHEPDIVVLYPSPSFFLENDPPPERLALPSAAELAAAPRPRAGLRVIPKAKLVLKRITPVSLQLALREAKLRRARAGRAPEWVWRSVPEDRLATYAAQLAQVLDTIAAIGAQPALVTHSNRFLHRSTPLTVADRQDLLAVISSYFPRASEEVIVGVDSAANRVLHGLAASRGALLIDSERRIPPDERHFADYSHFTDLGADRMARLIAEALLTAERRRSAGESTAAQPRTARQRPGPS